MKNIGCYDTYGRPREHPTLLETAGGGSTYNRQTWALHISQQFTLTFVVRTSTLWWSVTRATLRKCLDRPTSGDAALLQHGIWSRCEKNQRLCMHCAGDRVDKIHIAKCAKMTLKACKRPHKHLLSS